jgi:hypothetical protein
MSKKLTILALVSILALAGCGAKDGGSEQSKDSGLLSSLGGTKFYSQEELDKLEACELLPMETVLKYSNGAQESDIQQLDMFGCSYSWEKSNADEIEAANDKLMMDAGFKNLASLDLESEDNQISLGYNTFYPPQTEEVLDNTYRSLTNQLTQAEKDQADQALKDAFDSIGSGNSTNDQISEEAENMGVDESVQDKINEGFTEEEKEIGNSLLDSISEAQSKELYTDVDGLGDRAAWDEFSKSLVVQYNNFIFTINADLESSSKENAIKIAEEVLANIKSEL